MQNIRQSIEKRAGLDEELLSRCGHLLHVGAFDEAVRSAFVLLEERLRKVVDKEGITGTQLANYAFNPTDGPLAKLLGHNQSEREGLREFYSGAFKLFRNPAAHGTLSYDASDGKAIIGLVNMMLGMLKRVEDLFPLELLPENVEKMLTGFKESNGPGAAGRLRIFLGRCMKKGLKTSASAKQWVPFKRYGMLKFPKWDEPRPHNFAVFYFVFDGSNYSLRFSTDSYYSYVVEFNVDRLIEELTGIGFQLVGKVQEPCVDLKINNSRAFFDELFDLISRTVELLEGTLQR
jgi:uncharacterized protein (TIGR02391 family)